MPLDWNRPFYYMLDALFSIIVVFPLIVSFWSGSWKIVDIYCTPRGDKTFSSWLSLALGCFICVLTFFILPLGHGRIRVSFNIQHIIISRVFNYVSAWGVIFFWRGVWDFTDSFIGDSVLTAGIILAVTYPVLILLKAAQNVVGPPFVVLLDSDVDFYITYPRFRTQVTEKPFLYSIDAIFTGIIIQGLCVLVWVGLWNVFDAAIYPNDKFFSYVISLLAGIGSSMVLFVLQYPIFRLARFLFRRGHYLELCFENILHIISSVCVLLLWRGGWGLMKDFVLTDKLLWDSWLTHGVGFWGMMLTGTSRTLGAVGCAVDGELGEGHDVIRQISYFRRFCGTQTEIHTLNVQAETSDEDEDESESLVSPETGLPGSAAYPNYAAISQLSSANT